MKSHPAHDLLLGLAFDLLSPEEQVEVREHVSECPECSATLRDLVAQEERLTRTQERRVREPFLWTEAVYSASTPIVVMGLSVIVSALVSVPGDGVLSLPMLIGALLVTAWLHALVSRTERQWREVEDRDWRSSLDGDAAARAHFVQGLRLSVVESLRASQRKIRTVLVVVLLMTVLGMAVVLWAGTAEPELTSSMLGPNRPLLPGALALGVLLGGALWSSWRLTRLARRISRQLEAACLEHRSV